MRRSTNPRSPVHPRLKNTSTPNVQLPTPKPNLEPLGVGNWGLEIDLRALSRRRFMSVSAAALASAMLPASFASAQSAAQITATDLGGATLFQGAGCNVIALPGPDGALMIDGGLAANADALIAAIKKATGTTRINTLINTHWHPEQTGANEAVGKSGGVIFAHEKTKMMVSNTAYSAIGFTDRVRPLPQAARPTKTTRGDGSMEFAGLQIDYGYMPAAHTDGDLFVHVPKLNLLAAGGVVSSDGMAAARLQERRLAGRPRPRARTARDARQTRYARRARERPRDDRQRHRASP